MEFEGVKLVQGLQEKKPANGAEDFVVGVAQLRKGSPRFKGDLRRIFFSGLLRGRGGVLTAHSTDGHVLVVVTLTEYDVIWTVHFGSCFIMSRKRHTCQTIRLQTRHAEKLHHKICLNIRGGGGIVMR